MAEGTPATLPGAARRVASRWLNGLSRPALAFVLLLYILMVHAVGLGVFTYGFLLTRVTSPSASPAYSASNPIPIPATHSKAVVIIIDALRTDFISPHHPDPASPFHHGVLTLPAELTAAQPANSLLLNAYSDPPTTTMQRLKGLTTGSLPTFIDAGANFASTAIDEDNLLAQLRAANRSLVFMGDDTWLNLFPDTFDDAHPYDSFNVEDLHTVDNGVITHLFPTLETPGWNLAIGHFLGVDHVGHRVGPDRETMREKLTQMDKVLRDVVDKIDDDTLLVVLGDHGMNPKGDHGGDSDLETAAGMWIYSKKPIVNDPELDLPQYTFPGSAKPIRHINQIDLVPTLALLLGVPIPFNNLGTVIPELFAHDRKSLDAATRVNAEQIKRYIGEYGNRDVLAAVERVPKPTDDALSHIEYNRAVALAALEALRALWAQFSVFDICIGVASLTLSLLATIALYLGVRNSGPQWDVYVRVALDTATTAGAALGSVAGTVMGVYTREPAVAIATFIVAFAAGSSAALAAPLFLSSAGTWRKTWTWNLSRSIGPICLVLHAVSFASNSYIMWEDQVVQYLLITIALVYFGRALTAPMASLRLRILGFSLIFATLVRAMGLSTICREEQQPFCRVTFYGEAGAPAPEWAAWTVGIAAFMLLPRILGIFLGASKSFNGPAPFFLGLAWRLVITANALYWTLEFMETYEGLNQERLPLVRVSKLWIARASLGATLGFLPYMWSQSGLCINVKRKPDQTGADEEVEVYGFGNAYGASYLLFWLIPFALVHLVTPPVGQFVLIGTVAALLFHLEVIDSQRDSVLMRRQFAASASPGTFEPGSQATAIVRPVFTDVVPVALLGMVGFFATGHQAVLASIQWKAAFIGFETVTYPWSPALVVLNTWGPIFLAALAVPLVALWNVSPRPNASVPVLAHTVQLSLAFTTYFAAITLASAVCAAWLRRHLMVWKVFAPRFMLAGVSMIAVDVALILGLAGTHWVGGKVFRTFRATSV